MDIRNRASEESDQSAYPGSMSTGTPVRAKKNILHVVWRRRWWVVLASVSSLVAALFYLSRQTPIYSSSARLYVQQLSAMRYSGAAGESQPAQSLDTQCDLLRSDTLLQSVASLEEIKRLSAVRAGDPLGVIRSGLVVSSDKDYINIAFESAYPEDAAQIVNSIVQQFIALNDKQRSGTTSEVLKILTEEKGKRLIELKDSQKKTLDFRQHNNVLSFQDEKGNIVLQKLSKLSDSLTTAQLDVLDAEAQQKVVEALKADPVRLLDLARAETPKGTSINIDQAGNLLDGDGGRLTAAADSIRLEIEAAERQLARLRRTHTPEHKDVKTAEADLVVFREQLDKAERQIAGHQERAMEARLRTQQEMKSLVAKDVHQRQKETDKLMVDSYVASIQRRVDIAKQREALLASQVKEQKTAAFELNSVAAEYAFLESDMKRNERLVESLEEKMKEIHVTEDTGMIRVTALEMAKPGEKPIRPDRKRIIGMALLLGLIVSVGVVFALEAMDQRLRSVEEIMAVIDVPVLGLIPHIDSGTARSTRGKEVQLEPNSDVAEAYRTIRTAIYFAVRETKARKLLVTSPAPGDGKSTTASNLAIAMAQAGRRVLLIDADFRRPVQHKIFEVDADKGLSKVMAGLESVDSMIQRTDIENLDILGCGPVPSNPSEILNGQAFTDVLAHLEQQYDHLVIDSPPVAPVTDARILAAICDETLLVLRANKSTRRLTEHARESLSSVGARILGMVVNDVPRRRDRYGYYYGYSYGYGSGYGYYGYRYDSGGKSRLPVPMTARAIPSLEAEEPVSSEGR